MSRPSLTVVVVSRGLDALLQVALEHLWRGWPWPADPVRDRTVVVDNASPVPYLRNQFSGGALDLVRLDTHTGFGAASNLGVRSAPADLYLFLNNDVLLHPRALYHMVRVVEKDGVGICGARLLFPDGTLQHGGVVFSNDERGPYHAFRGQPTASVSRIDRTFQAVTGACMLVRHELFEQLDGFDDAYPFGLEDVDFCLRARQKGWRVVCSHAVDSLHFESMTEGRAKLNEPSHRLFMERWRGAFTVDG